MSRFKMILLSWLHVLFLSATDALSNAKSITRRPNILSFGNACVDLLAICDHFPVPDEKMRSSRLLFEGGGNAANTACAIGRLSDYATVNVATAIGNDDYADADKALTEADRLKPQAPEVAELRQTMQAAQQKEARRSSKVAGLLAAMRDAIARKDIAGADRAFNEASRIDILDPALEQARVELAQAHDAARDENR